MGTGVQLPAAAHEPPVLAEDQGEPTSTLFLLWSVIWAVLIYCATHRYGAASWTHQRCRMHAWTWQSRLRGLQMPSTRTACGSTAAPGAPLAHHTAAALLLLLPPADTLCVRARRPVSHLIEILNVRQPPCLLHAPVSTHPIDVSSRHAGLCRRASVRPCMGDPRHGGRDVSLT